MTFLVNFIMTPPKYKETALTPHPKKSSRITLYSLWMFLTPSLMTFCFSLMNEKCHNSPNSQLKSEKTSFQYLVFMI